MRIETFIVQETEKAVERIVTEVLNDCDCGQEEQIRIKERARELLDDFRCTLAREVLRRTK